MNPLHRLFVTTCLPLSLLLSGCGEGAPQSKAVFMLIDTSGTYTLELEKARNISNYLLANLNSGDSLALARIDSGSFSEKDILAKTTFDMRPSTANEQKRRFKHSIDEFAAGLKKGSPYTDITGAILQAAQYLHETEAGEKYILIFSDMEEDLPHDHIRNFPIRLDDIHVVALNVTKLRSDNLDPRNYLNRLVHWQQRVQDGGGHWRVVNDLERLDSLLTR